ncbi:hypothetical protein NDU88_001792 [Pleurodeles waltl]|uniref:Uncharacterized protein n=1 Tax=Pleurodeles waltl TaxID=8319 RepID=A0AAV7TKQ5_PLEWA|nr:hypothetical protein NDU88_001792 [Pleurodeles waltl]
MGAAPDAEDADFRVPGAENNNNGLRKGGEETSEATTSEDRADQRWTASVAEGARIEKQELLNERRRREEGTRPRETSAFCHVPGRAWLNKPSRRKKSKAETRPSKAQAAESQKQALKEANLFASPQRQTQLDARGATLDHSTDQSSGSTSPSVFGPERTPRMADDI